MTKTSTNTGAMALISSVQFDKFGGIKSFDYIPGNFSQATFYHTEKTAKRVYRHFTATPDVPCRMPSKLAQELFGLTKKELWHE